jgi:PIN domain nuclease of toxin-antitoxin system
LAGHLDWSHKDPFDRMLAAQAVLEDATLVSADAAFDSAPGVRRLWS